MTNSLDELAWAERNAFQEEQLAALYFIAGAIAFNAGWLIFGCFMVSKAALDILSCLGRWGRVHSLRASAHTSISTEGAGRA